MDYRGSQEKRWEGGKDSGTHCIIGGVSLPRSELGSWRLRRECSVKIDVLEYGWIRPEGRKEDQDDF